MIGIIFGKTKVGVKYIDLCLALLLFVTLSGGIEIGHLYRYYAVCMVSIIAGIRIVYTKKITLNKMTIYLGIFIAFLLFNVLHGYDVEKSMHFWITYFGLFLFLINDNIDSFWPRFIRIVEIVTIVIAVSIIVSAINPYVFAKVFRFILGRGDSFLIRARVGQYAGLANEIAEAAVLCNYGLAIEWSKILTNGYSRKRLVYLFILYIGLALTTKRTLLLVAVVIPFIFILLQKQSATTRFKTIGAVMIAALVGAILLMKVPALHFVLERFAEAQGDEDMGGRAVLWLYSMMMYKAAPLFGLGYGAYNSFFNTNGGGVLLNGTWGAYGHNVYLEALGEIGIIGSCLLWIPIAIVAVIGIFNFNKVEKKELRVEYVIWLYILLMFIFYGYTGNCTVYYQQLTMYIFSLYRIVSILELNNGIE